MTLARYSLLLTSLLILTSTAPFAQKQSSKVFARYNRPLQTISVDLATGTVTHAPRAHAKAAATIADFSNIDLSGFTGVDTGNSLCEWIDTATKGFAGNQSDLMSDIVFAYCSAKLSPSSGGPGGSVRLGFYEGYTVFDGAPTTAVAVLTLTGLPANSASSSFFGGFSCYFIQLDFGNLVAFADGAIGYSWRFLDQGTTNNLAGTWPFLACVASCSGVAYQIDGQGMTDFIDEYCPPGNLRFYCFGTPFGSFTSIAMEIGEATDLAATRSDYNGESLNRDVLSANAPVIGHTWQPLVTIPGAGLGHGHGSSGVVQVKVRATALNGPSGGPNVVSPLGGRLTEVLIGGPLIALVTGTHNGSVSSLPPQSVPLEMGFLCFHYASQATVIGGGFADLSSATEGTTGTF